MSDVYEYQRTPGKGVIWLGFGASALLLTAVVINDAHHLMWLVWVFTAMTVVWMLMPKPVGGIRVDDDYLVLSAWSQPRPIRLDDIAHLRAAESRLEPIVTVVYRDGREELIFAGDLPDIDTLITVMAERGIAVRDEYYDL